MLLLRLLGASLLLGNTVTAQGAAVAEEAISSPFNITASEPASEPPFQLMAGCSQGECPQSNAQMDFFTAHDMILTPERGWIRIDRCDRCQVTNNIGKGGGCHTFKTTCVGKLNVCADPKKMRGHWVEGNTGRKTCFSLKKNVYKKCDCGGGYVCDVSVYTPTKVGCTW